MQRAKHALTENNNKLMLDGLQTDGNNLYRLTAGSPGDAPPEHGVDLSSVMDRQAMHGLMDLMREIFENVAKDLVDFAPDSPEPVRRTILVTGRAIQFGPLGELLQTVANSYGVSLEIVDAKEAKEYVARGAALLARRPRVIPRVVEHSLFLLEQLGTQERNWYIARPIHLEPGETKQFPLHEETRHFSVVAGPSRFDQLIKVADALTAKTNTNQGEPMTNDYPVLLRDMALDALLGPEDAFTVTWKAVDSNNNPPSVRTYAPRGIFRASLAPTCTDHRNRL